MYQVGVILTDSDRKILWVNQDFEFITGYTSSEVMGRSPGEILQGPDSEPEVIERMRRNLAEGVSFRESITNYRKDGKPYICKLVIHPIYNALQEIVNFLAFEVDGDKVLADEELPMMRLNDRYRTSSLRGVEEVQLYQRIRNVMEQGKVFLDPNLSLRTLANMVDTNTKYLSQVINHFSNMNFLSFVNGYRIGEVKRLIGENQHKELTFFGVGQQCGFKNKSTFYKVFRDHTGMTPNAFAKTI